MNALLVQTIVTRTQKLRIACADPSSLCSLPESISLPLSGLNLSTTEELSYSSLLYMSSFICCIFNALYILSMHEWLRRLSQRIRQEDSSLRDENRDVLLAVNFRLIPSACLQLSISLFLAGLVNLLVEIDVSAFVPVLLLAGHISYTLITIRPLFDSEAPFKDYFMPTIWWFLHRSYLTGGYHNVRPSRFQ